MRPRSHKLPPLGNRNPATLRPEFCPCYPRTSHRAVLCSPQFREDWFGSVTSDRNHFLEDVRRNLPSRQLLGASVRYLGIEVDDAIEIADKFDI